RGFKVFSERAGCGLCHAPPFYTDLGYHRRGVGQRRPDGTFLDVGRFRATRKRADVGAFKTPTLRHLTLTAPYFHDGSAGSLEKAVARELARQRLSSPLTDVEVAQLIAFLRS